jgi:hypothetical protein
MAFKLIEAAQARWRGGGRSAPGRPGRAGVRFERGKLVERDSTDEAA